jgi:hypothetical protein
MSRVDEFRPNNRFSHFSFIFSILSFHFLLFEFHFKLNIVLSFTYFNAHTKIKHDAKYIFYFTITILFF